MPVVQRKTTDLASRGGRPAEPTGGASSIDGVKANEELRSNHIRTLQVTQSLEKENQRLKQQIAELQQPNARMKQEELDSLYVEERRLIETLERENRDLKQAATDMRAGRDGDASAAKAELQKLSGMCEALRDEKRRDANLAASQLEKIRSAFKANLSPRPPSARPPSRRRRWGSRRAWSAQKRTAWRTPVGGARSWRQRRAQGRRRGAGGARPAARRPGAHLAPAGRGGRGDAPRRARRDGRRAGARGEAAAREVAAAAEAALEEERKQRWLARRRTRGLAAVLDGRSRRPISARDRPAGELLEEAERERTAMVLPKVTAPAPAAQPQPPADDGRSVFTDFIGLSASSPPYATRTHGSGSPPAAGGGGGGIGWPSAAVGAGGGGGAAGAPAQTVVGCAPLAHPLSRGRRGAAAPGKQLVGSLAVGRRSGALLRAAP